MPPKKSKKEQTIIGDDGTIEKPGENVAVEEKAETKNDQIGKHPHDSAEPESASKKAKTDGKDDVKDLDHDAESEIAEPRITERKRGCLEKGQILFLAKPKVEQDNIESLDDVAKFHMLLLPEGVKSTTDVTSSVPSASSTDGVVSEGSSTRDTKFFRLIEIGKKRMPANEGHEIFWAAVSLVGSDLSALRGTLGPSTYETKTRGTRHVAESDVVGAGAYQIYCPDFGNENDWKTYLVYSLSVPETPAAIQGEFEIGQRGSIIMQVKDPRTPAAGPGQGFPSSRRVTYPQALLELFAQKNIAANPTSLLDYAAAELLLIGSGKNVKDKLGKDSTELDKESENVKEDLEDINKDLPEAAMQELHLSAKDINLDGLRGQWTR